MAPKVSVVTCSYNRPALLRAAIESLRKQTDPDWEHLIYDDASTDWEVHQILEWAMHDPRVRVWRGVENLDRPAVLWNYMLDRAMGRYFTVLDDDNEKLPTFVERMSHELDIDPKVDIVTCGWRVDRSEIGMAPEDYFLNLSTSAERLRALSTCDGGAMLYRREIFERAGYFCEDQRTNEDWGWLRRALHNGRLKNLHEIHSTYRSHNGSRMNRSGALGNDNDVARVKARRLETEFGARAVYPPADRLTQSQRDVCAGVASGLRQIPWLTDGNGLCLVVSPFQKTGAELSAEAAGANRILSLHMEDPYALSANLQRVQDLLKLSETWVCTNDAATVPYYQKLVGDRVLVCPSLSFNPSVPVPETNTDIDVLVCGYAYPSRKKFMTKLLPLLEGLRVVLVGDEWKGFACATMPTQPVPETYALHARARAIVCLHRVHGDCSDGAVEPATVNRGYMEGAFGARVFVDRTRALHSTDEGDIAWYSGYGDLAGALHAYLGNGTRHSPLFADKCRTLYTYRARLARIINCVRAPRYLVEIP